MRERRSNRKIKRKQLEVRWKMFWEKKCGVKEIPQRKRVFFKAAQLFSPREQSFLWHIVTPPISLLPSFPLNVKLSSKREQSRPWPAFLASELTYKYGALHAANAKILTHSLSSCKSQGTDHLTTAYPSQTARSPGLLGVLSKPERTKAERNSTKTWTPFLNPFSYLSTMGLDSWVNTTRKFVW